MASVPPPGPPNNPWAEFEAQQRRQRAALVVGSVLAAVVATLGVLFGTGLLKLGQSAPEQPSLQAKTPAPEPSLQVTQAPPDPGLTQPAQQPAAMPEDVRAWLEHLRQTEEARQNITRGQLAQAMMEKAGLSVTGGVQALQDLLNGIDDPQAQLRSPTEGLAQVMKQMHNEYGRLVDYFLSVPPPEECKPIRDAYAQAIEETTASIGDIGDHLAAGDIQALMGTKGKSAGTIDAPGKRADRLVGEICDKYNTPRWFSIASDITTEGVFGLGF